MKSITNNYRPIRNIRETVIVYLEDDCCYGCPYRFCPNRPDNAKRVNRPDDCIWSCYLRLSRKETK